MVAQKADCVGAWLCGLGQAPPHLSLSGLVFVDHCFAPLPRDLVTENSHSHLTGEGTGAGSQKPQHPPTVTASKWHVQDLNPELPPPIILGAPSLLLAQCWFHGLIYWR